MVWMAWWTMMSPKACQRKLIKAYLISRAPHRGVRYVLRVPSHLASHQDGRLLASRHSDHCASLRSLPFAYWCVRSADSSKNKVVDFLTMLSETARFARRWCIRMWRGLPNNMMGMQRTATMTSIASRKDCKCILSNVNEMRCILVYIKTTSSTYNPNRDLWW